MPSRTEANGETTLVHFLDLNDYGLEGVPIERRSAAKVEVANFLRNEVLRRLSEGTSPVGGEGRFPILDPDYATNEKGGVRTSNLELEGDLKDSLIVRPEAGSFIKYGHEGSQVPKSDGHNQISLKAKTWARETGFKKRRYIPDNGQTFDRGITREITTILNSFRETINNPELSPDEDLLEGTSRISSISESEEGVGVSTSSLFSDSIIDALLNDARNRRG